MSQIDMDKGIKETVKWYRENLVNLALNSKNKSN